MSKKEQSYREPHTQKDFTGTPLVVGEIYGMRTFSVSEEGELTSPVFEGTVFHEGVNEAVCQNSEAMREALASAVKNYDVVREELAQEEGVSQEEMPPGKELQGAVEARLEEEGLIHRAGVKACTCGFYAYHSLEANDFHHGGNVQGVIAGSGLVTRGSKGFRCEKCRVLGLIYQKPRYSFLLWPLEKCKLTPQNYKKKLDKFWYLVIAFFLLLVLSSLIPLAVLGPDSSITKGYGHFISFETAYVQNPFYIFWLFYSTYVRRTYGTYASVKLLQKRYPHLQWFASREAAAQAYPLGQAVETGMNDL